MQTTTIATSTTTITIITSQDHKSNDPAANLGPTQLQSSTSQTNNVGGTEVPGRRSRIWLSGMKLIVVIIIIIIIMGNNNFDDLAVLK